MFLVFYDGFFFFFFFFSFGVPCLLRFVVSSSPLLVLASFGLSDLTWRGRCGGNAVFVRWIHRYVYVYYARHNVLGLHVRGMGV